MAVQPPSAAAAQERLVRCLVVNPEVPKAPFPCCCPLADAGAAPGMQEVMAAPQPGAGAAPSHHSGCVVSPGMPPLAGDTGKGQGGAGKALLPPSACSSLGAGGKSLPWGAFTVLPLWVCTSGQRDNSLLHSMSLDQ